MAGGGRPPGHAGSPRPPTQAGRDAEHRVNGLYKAELIGPRGPWRTAHQVELATLAWVRWWNTSRLHGALGHIPPAEYEALYYRQLQQSKEVA